MIGRTDVVGFTRIVSAAGEVLVLIQTAMLAELPSTKLRDAVVLVSAATLEAARRTQESAAPAGRAKPRRNAVKPSAPFCRLARNRPQRSKSSN